MTQLNIEVLNVAIDVDACHALLLYAATVASNMAYLCRVALSPGGIGTVMYYHNYHLIMSRKQLLLVVFYSHTGGCYSTGALHSAQLKGSKSVTCCCLPKLVHFCSVSIDFVHSTV